jgi:hypothetical protein
MTDRNSDAGKKKYTHHKKKKKNLGRTVLIADIGKHVEAESGPD